MLTNKRAFLVLMFIKCVVSPGDINKLSKLSRSSFGHTYIIRTARSVIECCSQCIQDDACNSVAFAHVNKTCELNNRSPIDFPYTNITATPNKDLYYLTAEPCPESWILFDRHCYLVIMQNRTWKDSEDNCKTMGGNLTDITDAFDNTFVQDVTIEAGALREGSQIWIGLGNYHNATSQRWTSGRPLDYTYFRPGHIYGTEDCFALGYHGRWNVASCEVEKESVCKKKHY